MSFIHSFIRLQWALYCGQGYGGSQEPSALDGIIPRMGWESIGKYCTYTFTYTHSHLGAWANPLTRKKTRKYLQTWGNIWNFTKKVKKNNPATWLDQQLFQVGIVSLISTYWCRFVGNQATQYVHYMQFSNNTNLLDLKYYVTTSLIFASLLSMRVFWRVQPPRESCYGQLYITKKPRFFWGLVNPMKSWSVFFSAPGSIPTRSVWNGL